MKPHFILGDNNSLCDICGRAVKHSTLRMQWDKLFACKRCYDSKHPDLDPIIASRENPMIPDARPRPSFENLTFIDVPGLNVWGGVLNNGHNYDTEFTWGEMDITWDEQSINDDIPFN